MHHEIDDGGAEFARQRPGVCVAPAFPQGQPFAIHLGGAAAEHRQGDHPGVLLLLCRQQGRNAPEAARGAPFHGHGDLESGIGLRAAQQSEGLIGIHPRIRVLANGSSNLAHLQHQLGRFPLLPVVFLNLST